MFSTLSKSSFLFNLKSSIFLFTDLFDLDDFGVIDSVFFSKSNFKGKFIKKWNYL